MKFLHRLYRAPRAAYRAIPLRTLITLTCIALVCVGSVSVALLVREGANQRAEEERIVTDLERVFPLTMYQTLEGRDFDIASLAGKPLVVTSWASWCPDCPTTLAHLSAIKSTYRDDIQIIAINRKEPSDTIDAYRAAFPLPNNLTYIADSTDSFFINLHGYSMPEVVFYRADGSLLEHLRGTQSRESLEASVESLLAE
jgi:thiol-disulfide isomerase/thioredoxin